MSDYIIRKGTLEDIEELTNQYECLYEVLSSFGLPYDFDRSRFLDYSEALIRSKMFYLGVAESLAKEEKGILGFITVTIRSPRNWLTYQKKQKVGYVDDIFVLPKYRRDGCAKLLLEAGEQWLRDSGIDLVECIVMSKNQQGLGFWEKQSYKEYGKHMYRTLTDPK